ncbi:GNAT family N-acetyltransferase [Aurantivibrio infirmus]
MIGQRTIQLREAVFPKDEQALHDLIREYVTWLDIDLSYQDFESEMLTLNSLFTLPKGQYTFAIVDDSIAGGVGFRNMDNSTEEVKRLYVRDAYKGLGLGKLLMENLLNRLRNLNYERVVLDAVPPTHFAQGLYKAMGFYEISPHSNNPVAGTKFFQFNLSP